MPVLVQIGSLHTHRLCARSAPVPNWRNLLKTLGPVLQELWHVDEPVPLPSVQEGARRFVSMLAVNISTAPSHSPSQQQPRG